MTVMGNSGGHEISAAALPGGKEVLFDGSTDAGAVVLDGPALLHRRLGSSRPCGDIAMHAW